MRMPIKQQMEICAKQYKQWKQLVLSAKSLPEVQRYLSKALFWLELQNAFLVLWTAERLRGNDPLARKQLIKARANLSKKLAEHAENVLKELNLE